MVLMEVGGLVRGLKERRAMNVKRLKRRSACNCVAWRHHLRDDFKMAKVWPEVIHHNTTRNRVARRNHVWKNGGKLDECNLRSPNIRVGYALNLLQNVIPTLMLASNRKDRYTKTSGKITTRFMRKRTRQIKAGA